MSEVELAVLRAKLAVVESLVLEHQRRGTAIPPVRILSAWLDVDQNGDLTAQQHRQ